jgi:hypothetical protein
MSAGHGCKRGKTQIQKERFLPAPIKQLPKRNIFLSVLNSLVIFLSVFPCTDCRGRLSLLRKSKNFVCPCIIRAYAVHQCIIRTKISVIVRANKNCRFADSDVGPHWTERFQVRFTFAFFSYDYDLRLGSKNNLIERFDYSNSDTMYDIDR